MYSRYVLFTDPELLRDTHTRIYEVAEGVDLSNYKYFSQYLGAIRDVSQKHANNRRLANIVADFL